MIEREGQNTAPGGLTRLVCLAAILALGLAFAARLRLLEAPLERDEGEYAYAGWLMTQGVPPYEEAYNMKNPGIYYAYAAAIQAFGPSVRGVHWGLVWVNLATCLCVGLCGARLFGGAAGLTGAGFYAVLSVLPKIQGAFANSEHFVLLPALAGLWFFLLYLGSRRLKWLCLSGLCFGAAFLVKQHGIFYGLFAGLWLLCEAWREDKKTWPGQAAKFGLFVACCALPFTLSCAYLYRVGVLEKFYFWTVDYARQYVGLTPLWLGAQRFVNRPFNLMLNAGFLPWLFSGLGFGLLYKDGRREFWFLGGLALFSLFAVCPGLHLRWHYYLLFLPGIVFAAGYASLAWPRGFLKRGRVAAAWAAAGLAACALLLPLVLNAEFLFAADMGRVSRMAYPENPFPETLELGKYIERISAPDDVVAVVGSEPQINFYAKRKSGTGYIYMYPLLEEQDYAAKMRADFLGELDKINPRYIVYVNVRTSWDYLPQYDQGIFNWLADNWARHYELLAYMDVNSALAPLFASEGESLGFALDRGFGYLPLKALQKIAKPGAELVLPRSREFILLLKRRD